MKRKRKFLRLTVTSTEEFMIDLDAVDGRTEQEVVDEWFTNFPLHQRHAARDYCKVGYSKKLVGVENHGVVTEGDEVSEPSSAP